MALSPQIAAQVQEVLRQVDAAAARADAAASSATSGLSSWWQGIVGSSSSAEALASVAHSQHSLADAVRARADKLDSDAAALAFLQDAKSHGWASFSIDLEGLARFLSLEGGASTIAADSARDLGTLAKIGAPVLLVGALVLLALRFGGRRP